MIISRKIPKQILTAGIGLSITFAVSCGEHDLGELYISSSGTEISSSGGSNVSSSSVSNSSAWISCGSRTETFDPDLYECRAGDKIYLKTPVSYKGDTYDAVLIGAHTWMAKNLNYNVSGSRCYGNAESDCNKYGRLYDWETARVVCPSGWHLPSDSDWGELVSHVESDNGCSSCAAQHLKSKSGWSQSGNGIDTYGFSALPGGKGSPNGGFIDAGNYGYWWTATEVSADYAYCKGMLYWIEYVIVEYRGTMVGSCNGGKTYLNSVRCVQD